MKIVSFFKRALPKIFSNSPGDLPIEASAEDRRIIDFCKRFSMGSYERFWATVSATKYIAKNGVPGAFVECGVWRGGNSFAMAMALKDLNITDRQFYLFDTFEGMTAPSDNDKDHRGVFASVILDRTEKGDGDNIWCIASIEDVKQNFKSTNYPLKRLSLIKGDVAITLREVCNLPEEIALLRLDTDWYESTKIELEVLYPRLVKGGVCLIDDYGHWQGARRAVDEYFEQNDIFPLVHVTDYTGRAFIKV